MNISWLFVLPFYGNIFNKICKVRQFFPTKLPSDKKTCLYICLDNYLDYIIKVILALYLIPNSFYNNSKLVQFCEKITKNNCETVPLSIIERVQTDKIYPKLFISVEINEMHKCMLKSELIYGILYFFSNKKT